MTYVKLVKTQEYLKIQESLRSQISHNIIYTKEYFHVFFYPERYYTSTK